MFRQVMHLMRRLKDGLLWHQTKEQHTTQVVEMDSSEIEPFVTWGTNPSMGSGISNPCTLCDVLIRNRIRKHCERRLPIWDLEEGTPLTSIDIQHVFIGSCTNARLSDFRAAAKVIEGKKVHPAVTAIVVPGSRYS